MTHEPFESQENQTRDIHSLSKLGQAVHLSSDRTGKLLGKTAADSFSLQWFHLGYMQPVCEVSSSWSLQSLIYEPFI